MSALGLMAKRRMATHPHGLAPGALSDAEWVESWVDS